MACDEYVFEALRHLNSQILADPGSTAPRQGGLEAVRALHRPIPDRRIRHRGPIFDEMVTMTEVWLARSDDSRADPPVVDRRIRAALVTAMALGIPLLHEHVSRALGAGHVRARG